MTKKALFLSGLILMVGLSGCLGESENSGAAQTNSRLIALEIINDCENTEVNIQSTDLANGTTMDTILGINVSVYHSIYTPDVSGLVFGYDTNLDGDIDVFDNSSKGVNNLSIPLSEIEYLTEDFFLHQLQELLPP